MRQPLVVYGITSGISANSLLRGQLGWLRGQGWDVHLAVDPDERANAAAEREGVHLEPLPMRRDISPAADVRSLVAWLRLIRRLRPDAVNVSTPKAGLLGGLAAAALRVPKRVYVLRGLRVEGARGLTATLLWAIEKVSIACATDVVVVSASLAAEARRRHLLPRRGAWLIGSGSSNGVLSADVVARVSAVDAAALREGLGLAPTDVVVGYVGRITGDKGVETLLDAAAALAGQVRLLLVGSVDEADLQGRIARIQPKVAHVDWTNDPWSYYAALDVLCLPTRREGFPNVVLEAASAGVPTVTTTATGAVDSVIDGVTGLIVPVDDAEALADALRLLADDPGRRRSLGSAARRRVETDFVPQNIWRGVDAILRGRPDPTTARIQ